MHRRRLVRAAFSVAALAALPQKAVAQVGTPEGSATDPANPFVAGTGLELVPEGKPNTVEVVLQSPLIDTDVVFVIRNTTPQTVTINDVIGTVRDNAGKLLDTVAYSGFGPKTLEPNGVAFGNASFRESSLPLDVVVELVAKASQGVSNDYISMPVVDYLNGIRRPDVRSCSRPVPC